MKSIFSLFLLGALILSFSTTLAVKSRVYADSSTVLSAPCDSFSSDSSMTSNGLSSLQGSLPISGLSNQNGGITIVELGEKQVGIPNWSVSGTEIKSTDEYPLGLFTGNTVVSRSITLAASSVPVKTVAVRFRLHLLGVWSGQQCSVSAGNQKIFQDTFAGTDFFKDVELQVPFGLTVIKLTFGCDVAGVSSIQGWTLTDVGFHSSTCPLKYIKDMQTGDCTYVGNSLFSGLIKLQGTSFMKTGNDIPAWASTLEQGNNNNAEQNSQILVVDKTPVTSAASEVQGNGADLSQLLNVYLLLIGANSNYSSFTSTGNNGGLTYFNGYPVYGLFSGNNAVSTQFTTLPSTKSVALRVRLYLIGTWQNVPFTFSAGGNNILSTKLSGQNTLQDIEIMFSTVSQKPITLSMGIANSGAQSSTQQQVGSPEWALSDVAIALNNAPAGQIYNTQTGASSPVKTSFYTTVLNGVYSKNFPGYSTQPVWLSKVVNGLYSPEMDIIAVNGKAVTIPTTNSQSGVPVSAYAPGVSASNIAGLISTELYLIGSNFNHSSFQATPTAGMTMFNGYPVFGYFSGSNIVSKTLNALPSTKSGAVRVRLYLTDVWAQVPFGFTVNGNNVLNTQLTGTNTFQDIELQFELASGKPATLAMGIPQSSTPIAAEQAAAYKWAISDVAIVLSNTKPGEIYQPASGETAKVPTSFFTQLLTTVYNEQFPESSVQPVWLNKVAFGQFSPQYDIIASNGSIGDIINEIINQYEGGENSVVPNSPTFPGSPATDTIIINELPVAPIATLSTTSPSATNSPVVSTVNLATLLLPQLLLVGNNLNTSNFAVEQSPNSVGQTYVNGVPVFGVFSGPTQVSTTLHTLPTTQAVAVRLRIYISPRSLECNSIQLHRKSVSCPLHLSQWL